MLKLMSFGGSFLQSQSFLGQLALRSSNKVILVLKAKEKRAIIEAIESTFKENPYKGEQKVFEFSGSCGQAKLVVRGTENCTPSREKRILIALGLDRDFVEAFVSFRKSNLRARKSTSKKCLWREDLLRRATWGEYTGEWIRKALPTKSQLRWDKDLAAHNKNWYQARLTNEVVAAAISHIAEKMIKAGVLKKGVSEGAAEKYVEDWKKRNL